MPADLRNAFRTFRTNPGFAAVVVLTLALGIGATTAVFTVVDAVMLRPYPYPDMHRIVSLMETTRRGQTLSVAWPNFQDWRAQNQVFERLGLYRAMVLNLTGAGQAERLVGSLASSEVFGAVGMNAIVGQRAAADMDAVARRLERDYPLSNTDHTVSVVPYYEQIVQNVRPALLTTFGALALVLASLGVYGVLSYVVGRRTHEIGIRVALGATRGDVMRSVVGHGLALAMAGIVIGLSGAWALTRLLSTLLFGISAHDPPTYALAATLLAAVACVASYLPGRRATRVDPLVALRCE
jgi:ABC-type antimicrobial peptide transport system permease subunit